jgi:hypothetical protein
MRHLDSQRWVLSFKKKKKKEDPQPETSSEGSNHERSMQGPCNVAYKIFRYGLRTYQSKCTELIFLFH